MKFKTNQDFVHGSLTKLNSTLTFGAIFFQKAVCTVTLLTSILSNKQAVYTVSKQ